MQDKIKLFILPRTNNNSIKRFSVYLVCQQTERTLVEEIAKYITKIMQALADNNIHIRASES